MFEVGQEVRKVGVDFTYESEITPEQVEAIARVMGIEEA